jgi:hypothetical protein
MNAALMCLRVSRRKRETSLDELTETAEARTSFDLVETRLNPEQEYLSKEGRVLLEKGLKKLGPLYVEVVHLRSLQELSIKETAGILDLPVGTVKRGCIDRELTEEIARLTNSTPKAVEQREWKNDPAVYRVFKSFLRGAFEGGLPPTDRLELLDARRIAAVSEQAVNQALSSGPCVIVGRGSQYFLRNRKDVFRVFLYASRTSKIHRLITAGIPQEKAINDVDSIDRDRAAFITRYFKLNWPEIHLSDAMFNTETGDSFVAEMLARCVQQVARRTSVLPEFTDAQLTI